MNVVTRFKVVKVKQAMTEAELLPYGDANWKLGGIITTHEFPDDLHPVEFACGGPPLVPVYHYTFWKEVVTNE